MAEEDGPVATILVVDDDDVIRTLLSQALAEHGFEVLVAHDALTMDQVLAVRGVDLLLLDVMMPGEQGIDCCRRLTREGGPIVVLLSALGGEDARIVGLECGASHYLSKPCSTREIVATVRAALRARRPVERRSTSALRFEGWSMDVRTHELIDPDGALVVLTDGEFALLRVLAENARRVLSRDRLLDLSRGTDSEAFDRAVDVQISRLRRKLRAPGNEMIRTVRHEGYVFVPSVQFP